MSETMGTGASVTRTHRAFAAALVVVLLLWNNVVVPRLPSGSYALVNGAAAGLLLVAARSTGLSWEQLGLSRGGLPSGLRWGAASFAVVTAAYATALAIPALRPLLADDRVLGLGAREVATEVLVRIPLGTVLWEEVAFRGVLLAALLRVLPVRRAVVGAAAVFGLWHIRPTVGGVAANDLTDTPWLLGLAVLVGCTATGAAGLLFTWLRLRSGSLLAPAMLHLATNAVGVLAATVAHRVG